MPVWKRSHSEQEDGTMLKQFLLKVKQTNVQEVCLSVKHKNQQEWKKKTKRDNKVDSKSSQAQVLCKN